MWGRNGAKCFLDLISSFCPAFTRPLDASYIRHSNIRAPFRTRRGRRVPRDIMEGNVPGSLPEGLQSALQLPDEFFAVDDFWDTYVDSLRHSQDASLAAGPSGQDKTKQTPARANGKQPASKRRKRDAEANKAAQARFRERKKRELEEMQSKLVDYEALKRDNERLVQLNARLSEEIFDMGRELAKWRTASESGGLKVQESLTSSRETVDPSSRLSDETGTAVAGGALPAGASKCPAAACMTSHIGSNPRFSAALLDPAALKKEFSLCVRNIRARMEKWGVSLRHVPGEDPVSSLSEEAREELWGVILGACQACQKCLMSSGPDVGSLMKEWRGEHHGMHDGDADGEKTPWQLALEAMNLRSSQRKELLLLRSRHLDSMKKVYEERQRLNLLAISKMVDAPEDIPNDATTEGKIQSISKGASLGLARRNAGLGDLLDKIKGNLRTEQKAIMSFNCSTLTQLLDCVQAARYMVSLYPMHCDALALANAIQCEEDRDAKSTG